MTGTAREIMRYDGTFDLSFLREGEVVGSNGDGSCWVEQPTGPGTVSGLRLDVGQVLERLPGSGLLIAYDPAPGQSVRS